MNGTEIMLLENPHRRRKHKRTARRKRGGFAKKILSKVRRSRRPPARKVPAGRPIIHTLGVNPMKHKRKHSRRRFHRNPSMQSRFASVGGGFGGTLKQAAVGTLGIFANNLISGLVGGALGSTSIPGLGSPKGLVKILLPVVAAGTIGKRNATIRAAATVAASVAIFEALKAVLPAGTPGLAGEPSYSPELLSVYSDDGLRTPIQGYEQSVALPSSIAV